MFNFKEHALLLLLVIILPVLFAVLKNKHISDVRNLKFKILVALAFSFFMFWALTYKSPEEKKEILYARIPDIYVYSSNVRLKDDLIYQDSRSLNYVTAQKEYTVNTDDRKIVEYYENHFSKNGWVLKNVSQNDTEKGYKVTVYSYNRIKDTEFVSAYLTIDKHKKGIIGYELYFHYSL